MTDQVEDFSRTYLNQLEQRLASQDETLASMMVSVKELQDKSHIWDTFQHHVTSWAALMTTVDSKVDHISR